MRTDGLTGGLLRAQSEQPTLKLGGKKKFLRDSVCGGRGTQTDFFEVSARAPLCGQREAVGSCRGEFVAVRADAGRRVCLDPREPARASGRLSREVTSPNPSTSPASARIVCIYLFILTAGQLNTHVTASARWPRGARFLAVRVAVCPRAGWLLGGGPCPSSRLAPGNPDVESRSFVINAHGLNSFVLCFCSLCGAARDPAPHLCPPLHPPHACSGRSPPTVCRPRLRVFGAFAACDYNGNVFSCSACPNMQQITRRAGVNAAAAAAAAHVGVDAARPHLF